MKTGAIVYITGVENLGAEFNLEHAVKRLDLDADRVEVVSKDIGHFDVMDAWWMLIVKGVKSVVCLMAEVIGNSELRLTGRQLRLCG